jgi:hypothetical protein
LEIVTPKPMVGKADIEAWLLRGRQCARLLFTFALLALAASPLAARAAIQFDVFLGYNGIVPEASWFPIVCEIKNDGPTFTGTVEVDTGTYNAGQVRRLEVELPTGTLKRVVIPVFTATRGYISWDVRLLDGRGKVRSEQTGLRPTKQIGLAATVVGAIPRTANGTPGLQAIQPKAQELQPATARFQTSIFPDNPLVLERLNCLYLNSERAADLSVTQVRALLAWVHAGGHLIVAVEQPSEIGASPWLKNIFPCDVKDLQPVTSHAELQSWLVSAWPATTLLASENQPGQPQFNPNRPRRTSSRMTVSETFPFNEGSLPADAAFESAPLQVAVGTVREGNVVLKAGETPLVVTAPRGNGRVTALLFSPEREPVRSWKNLPTFWARLAEVPGAFYLSSDFNQQQSTWSTDSVFGAMIDTRQVHKLPVGWLLLLLMVYLVVIGPLDQYWLKRIGKPMLTWITFPCYVVAFSLVIYLIGYKLRAGESEWNELHVVDVLPTGDRAELRGRTYSSVYAPSNQRYLLQSQQPCATFRGEFAGLWGGQTAEKATIVQNGDTFKAEIFVPVWTSQLFVSDWWQPAAVPVSVNVHPQGDGWQVKVQNFTEHKLTNLHLVVGDDLVTLPGDLSPGDSKILAVSRGPGSSQSLRGFVSGQASGFQNVVQRRQRAFGESEAGQLSDLPNSSIAASFMSQAGLQGFMFISPPGLDLTPVLDHGEAVLLAWSDDASPIKPSYQFTPRRSHRHTLWRVATTIQTLESK